MTEWEVWIEQLDGRRWPVAATCSIGRAPSNDIVIDDGHVSRRHALIHKQDSAEYWIIDLGSGNGTYLNGRRVTMSTRLSDGDAIAFGRNSFTFRQATRKVQRAATSPVSVQTIIQFTSRECWLLVADIKGSSALAQRLATTELAVLVGKWTAHCKEIVETNKGAINKYLGDGFLAFWPYAAADQAGITGALDGLIALQRAPDSPPFRLALHRGVVTIGGAASTGEDSLSGPDVIRVFRMEKLASALARDVLVSEEVQAVRALPLSFVDEGLHELPGFEGSPRRYYSVR